MEGWTRSTGQANLTSTGSRRTASFRVPLTLLQLLPARHRRRHFRLDFLAARLQLPGALRVAAEDAAVGEMSGDVGLLALQCLDAPGQFFQFARFLETDLG